jgi:septal ring-binding cell division protein DamX
LQLAPLTLEETNTFLDETVKSMQPLNIPAMSQATTETIYQESLGIPRDIARLAEEQLHPEHFDNPTAPEELTITEVDSAPEATPTTKDEHPLDLVRPTKPNSGEKSFWDKYGVKLLSLILLILVFVFLHQYEHKIQHEDIGYTAPMDSKPTAIVPEQQPMSLQTQPAAQPASQPAPKPVVQSKPTKKVTVANKPKPTTKASASYHWQLMASPKQTVINQALNNPALKDLDPYMLSKQMHGKTWYTLNIGKFNSKAQAKTMLKNAPTAMLKHKPWLVATKS